MVKPVWPSKFYLIDLLKFLLVTPHSQLINSEIFPFNRKCNFQDIIHFSIILTPDRISEILRTSLHITSINNRPTYKYALNKKKEKKRKKGTWGNHDAVSVWNDFRWLESCRVFLHKIDLAFPMWASRDF